MNSNCQAHYRSILTEVNWWLVYTSCLPTEDPAYVNRIILAVI